MQYLMPRSRRVPALACAIGLLLGGVQIAAAQSRTQDQAQAAPNACGPLANHFGPGPFDYRNDRSKIDIVEQYHFTPEVELLLRGKTTAYLEEDIAYTLRAFPNHPRALVALTRLGEKTKNQQPGRLEWPIECFYERALRFRPDDRVVRMLYADYLGKRKRPKEALIQLDYVRDSLAGDDPLTRYNLGMLYLDLGRPEEALAEARRARALGVQRRELIEQLQTRGLWREPEAGDAAAIAPAAASAPSATEAAASR
ncbi:MAG: hypothetical protein RL223_836 [Pseudomonadota bacterium]